MPRERKMDLDSERGRSGEGVLLLGVVLKQENRQKGEREKSQRAWEELGSSV